MNVCNTATNDKTSIMISTFNNNAINDQTLVNNCDKLSSDNKSDAKDNSKQFIRNVLYSTL